MDLLVDGVALEHLAAMIPQILSKTARNQLGNEYDIDSYTIDGWRYWKKNLEKGKPCDVLMVKLNGIPLELSSLKGDDLLEVWRYFPVLFIIGDNGGVLPCRTRVIVTSP